MLIGFTAIVLGGAILLTYNRVASDKMPAVVDKAKAKSTEPKQESSVNGAMADRPRQTPQQESPDERDYFLLTPALLGQKTEFSRTILPAANEKVNTRRYKISFYLKLSADEANRIESVRYDFNFEGYRSSPYQTMGNPYTISAKPQFMVSVEGSTCNSGLTITANMSTGRKISQTWSDFCHGWNNLDIQEEKSLKSPKTQPELPVIREGNEAEAFEITNTANTIAAFRQYLAMYPGGQNAGSAVASIVKLSAREQQSRGIDSQAPLSYLVFFDFGRAELYNSALATISQAVVAYSKGQSLIIVTGHTDTAGVTDGKTIALQRAQAVKDALIQKGVPAQAIIVASLGNTALRVQTPKNVREPQNRRAEILVVP